MLHGFFGNGLHLPGRPDIARIDAQAVCARLDCCHGQSVVEMNIGDQGDGDLFLDGCDCLCGCLIRYCYADKLAAHGLQAVNLCHRGTNIVGEGIGHGLDGNWRATTDFDPANRYLSGLFASCNDRHNIIPKVIG